RASSFRSKSARPSFTSWRIISAGPTATWSASTIRRIRSVATSTNSNMFFRRRLSSLSPEGAAMKMKLLLVALIALVHGSVARAALQTKEVTYNCKGVTLKGYLAWDDTPRAPNKIKRPGVLIVHEWWGLNDYARKRAEELAKMGYVAFACDMYGDG